MGHRQNIFNAFRLLMKLKRHFVELSKVQISFLNVFKEVDLVWLIFPNHILIRFHIVSVWL